jgi:hypothetical protein
MLLHWMAQHQLGIGMDVRRSRNLGSRRVSSSSGAWQPVADIVTCTLRLLLLVRLLRAACCCSGAAFGHTLCTVCHPLRPRWQHFEAAPQLLRKRRQLLLQPPLHLSTRSTIKL